MVTAGALSCVFLLMVLIVLGVVRVSRLTSIVDRNQRGNTTALCALRSDLRTRVDSSLIFLLHHPHGVLGISRATILQSIDGQQRTIRALAVVRCPPRN